MDAVVGQSAGLPLAVLCELTHRCPLRCPYCSNPLMLEEAANELTTEQWRSVLEQAAGMGVLQVHFSGGEPAVRKDLETLIGTASEYGLYGNLITSAMLMDAARVARFAAAGLAHMQISIQDAHEQSANTIAGCRDAFAHKFKIAAAARANGLSVTVNAPLHRMNIGKLESIIGLALEMGASRLEAAHVQYYGWAYHNRAALMPTLEQVRQASRVIERARARLKGAMTIDYVPPDYYARRPKACMGGWGRQFLNITPSGKVLPCHAAESLTTLRFDNVKTRSLKDIWMYSEAFEKYRGSDWMPAQCQHCERRETDWGGCRCQAFAITGDADNMDPACEFSPHHDLFAQLADHDSSGDGAMFDYRRMSFKVRREC